MRSLTLLFLFWLATPAQALTMLLAAGSGTSFDPALPHLKYAGADAEQFAGAMRSVGLTGTDVTNLRLDPTRDELIQAFEDARSAFNAEADGGARKFIFYYSGHADERGLHLKDGLFATSELHRRLARISARTKVIILDSCYAAALASKGVKPVEGMLGPRIGVDEPTGTVFLTASSARDVALESSVTRGSLFTGQLIAGLYGDADGNKDGVVTATELYEYAFRKTQLASYMLPIGSPQKPEMIEDLKGRGAIALSFPAGKMGRLQLPTSLSGRVSVQAVAGITSLELQKAADTSTDLALPAGAYELWVKDGPRVGQASFNIATDRATKLASNDVTWRDVNTLSSTAMVKGGSTDYTVTAASRPQLHLAPFVGGGLFQAQGISGHGYIGELSLARDDREGSLEGLGFVLSGRRILTRYNDHETRSAAYLAYQWNPLAASRYGVGIRLDAGLGGSSSSYSESATTVSADARAGIAFTLTRGMWLGLTHETPILPSRRFWDTIGLGYIL